MNEWRLTDHTAAAGVSHGAMWLRGAERAFAEARDGGGELWGLWLGVVHFVHCLHHLRKCVEMAAANVPDDIEEDIRELLAAFDRAVPDLVSIRDIIEHYEDGYALGKGNLQQPGVRLKNRRLDGQKSVEWTVVPDYIDGDCRHPVIRAAGYEVRLAPALEAGRGLLEALYLRVRNVPPHRSE